MNPIKKLKQKILERVWRCPKCKNGTLRLNVIGGYLNNPWGYWVRCDNRNCAHEIYYDNPNWDKSKAVYSEDGELLG